MMAGGQAVVQAAKPGKEVVLACCAAVVGTYAAVAVGPGAG